MKNLFPQPFFYAYLLILCWAPLPMASNRLWSLNLLTCLCFILAATLLSSAIYNNRLFVEKLARYKLVIILLGIVPLWSTIQTLALPSGLLQMLSPAAAKVFELSELGNGVINSSISLEPGRTIQWALFSWALWLFFIMSILLVDTPARARKLFITIVLCGVFQALYGSFMTLSGLEYGFFQPKEAYLKMATGTFVNRNHLAGYLEMCLAIGIGLLVASLSKRRHKGWRNKLRSSIDTMLGAKMRLRIFLALMVVALVLTRSRMGNAAFFLSLPLCGVVMMVLQRKLHKGAIILFVSLMLVDFLIIGQWFGFDELAKRMQSTSLERETRDEVVRDSLVILQDYSIAGTGLGTFDTAYPQYRGSDVWGFYDHTHNDYLEFSTNLGLIGFLPLVLLVLYSLNVALRSLYRRRDQLARGLAFAASMGIVSLLIHSTVDFNLQIPANALLFIVLLAIANIARNIPGEDRDK